MDDMTGSGFTFLVFILLMIALVVVIFRNAKWNYPTWKGIIISALLAMLPLYLFFCFMGWMGEENTSKENR